jgi:hypothetical protein
MLPHPNLRSAPDAGWILCPIIRRKKGIFRMPCPSELAAQAPTGACAGRHPVCICAAGAHGGKRPAKRQRKHDPPCSAGASQLQAGIGIDMRV